MQALLDYGLNINVVNKDGATPLEAAQGLGFNEMVVLLKKFKDVELEKN